ncbi:MULTISPECIES: LysE family translocator [Chromohalobacter]|uniref:LysE family translocator n=1 Tax=Chromohalobacter TaxID=42054 RepID=UPI001FFCB903|nr:MULTISPECIES: LysE family translocator [Chromohalobacter]MCK2045513.1 LysE family translocator [Chromohalobacter moromii]MCT8468423.1 LysE family translocator [Chromohalobacter canadensis]MCT8471478.1 LysE family translocator [Chromohalobacter canadensis]MCT8498931.1 LysE family translocator [Chromohalobacter canadensis]
MSLSLWLSLAAVCAMGAMSPGPSLAMVLRHTLGGGRMPGVVAGVCHAAGVGFYAALTVWGLGAVIVHQPVLFQAITWGGAAYLAWLGVKALRAGRGGALEAGGVASGPGVAARDGVLVALANPKLILFFVALLSQFVSADMGAGAKTMIVATASLIDAGWYVLVALALSHSSVLPWLQARAHWINRMTGVLLLGLALRIVIG